jgi:hypothetical protein
MIIESDEIQPEVFYLVSNMRIPEIAERDFLDWADEHACYPPTASEMDRNKDHQWTVLVMKEPVRGE